MRIRGNTNRNRNNFSSYTNGLASLGAIDPTARMGVEYSMGVVRIPYISFSSTDNLAGHRNSHCRWRFQHEQQLQAGRTQKHMDAAINSFWRPRFVGRLRLDYQALDVNMLDKAFRKMDELFASLNTEFDRLIYNGICIRDSSGLTIAAKDGCVSIKGTLKELRINGKLVRFKGE